LYDKVIEFANKFNDLKMNPSKSAILRLGYKKLKPISFYNIPSVDKVSYLGSTISQNLDDEVVRANKSLYTRTNLLFKQNVNIRYCKPDIKNIVLNSFGNVYAIETFAKLSSKMTNAHRFMTKTLFPEFRRYLDINNKDIRSRTLYKIVCPNSNSLPEIHRLRRNKFIIKAKSSGNPFIRDIIGNIPII